MKPAIKVGCKCYQEGNIPNTSLRNTVKDKNMLLPSSESVILKVIVSRITAEHILPATSFTTSTASTDVYKKSETFTA
jgi:hypothetical protein